MTIQQLQYVLEISRTGSVSKAAKTLYLSQPNLSNAIKNLENELGITIFERTPMGMQLTASFIPLAVSCIPMGVRSNMVIPSSFSRFLMALLKLGWDR